MNPTNQIDYPHYQPNNDERSTSAFNKGEDIFDQLIKRIRTLQLVIENNKQVWKYFLYATLLIIMGVIAYLSTYGI